ncbi:MAG: hypothetical protein ACOC30_03365, partial [Marinilabilia sp.]
GPLDYALSEISRLVEDADAKILNLYVYQKRSTDNILLTIKVNRVNVENVVNAFERYNYRVKAIHVGEAHVDDTTRRNYESLMKYLSV